MSEPIDLDNFKNLEYDVIIKRRGKRFILFISEIGIIVEDEDLGKAYQRIELEKEKYIKKMVELDLQDEIMQPRKEIRNNPSGNRIFINNLALFMTKFVILIFVGTFICTVATKVISKRVENIKKASFSQFISDKTEVFCDKINDMPPEKLENMKLKIRAALKKLQPIINEFKISLQDINKSNAMIASGGQTKKKFK